MKNHTLIALTVLILLSVGCVGKTCPDTVDPVCGSDGETYANACFAEKAGVSIEKKGPCEAPVPACVDSDGGKDIFASGEVVSHGESYGDGCYDSNTVKEYFCEDGDASSDTVPCPSGYECKGSKCIVTPCTDSDGGVMTATKGTTTAGDVSETDGCLSNGSLKEFFCDEGAVSFKYTECPVNQFCDDGACIEYSCSDSDGGKDKFKLGTTTDGKESNNDSCYDGDTVTEYYCSGSEIKSEKMDCGSGFECDEGICVELVCSDSDNGKNKFEKGDTTYDTKSYTDSCYSDTQVLEYFCSSNTEIDMERLTCGPDYECYDGMCRIVECAAVEEDVDDSDVAYEIDSFGDSDLLRLYEGNIVEIRSGMILKLHQVSGNDSVFRLYSNYEEYEDNDYLCSETITEGDTENDLCGENTNDVEVDTVDSTDNYAEIYLDDFYAMQYYSQRGTIYDRPDHASCQDDEVEFRDHTSYFYPYLDTSSSGLNLDGENFKLFDGLAELDEVDADSIRFTLDGEHYNLEDGDTFEYKDVDYDVQLTFNEGGLYRMDIEKH